MTDAVIIQAVRTPHGRRNGALADIHPVDLSAHALTALLGPLDLDPGLIDDVVWGVVGQVGDQSVNVGRSAVLAAGLPESLPGVTIDRQCGSSQQAVHFAAAMVISEQSEFVIAGGVESMSRVPIGTGRIDGCPWGQTVLDRYGVDTFNQGEGAELVADKWDIGRTEMDEWSLRSHQRAAAATDAGAFDSQLAVFPGRLEVDEGIRRTTSLESLAGLRPAFREDGRVTAGNSSQISDGAAALLVTTSELAQAYGQTPIARVRSTSVVGSDPVMMLSGVIPATEAILRKSGLSIADIGVFEVNEAFAPVPIAWVREFGADEELVNPQGGAIALGHPLGGSGASIMTRMVHHMLANQIKFGLQTMCEGGGMANATLLELI
ncbi:thiolase family protein [Nocardioides hungaricus]